ncbi:STAS domain-containing protein [Actinophytocola algeriensis]|uniref:STAS domain-containing protein n=1 Tax=Actinophytocola algeriensis TaxID=1768010 RepID=UPI0035E208A0
MDNSAVVVHAIGEVDLSNAALLSAELTSAAQDASGRLLVLDMSRVSFMSSSGVASSSSTSNNPVPAATCESSQAATSSPAHCREQVSSSSWRSTPPSRTPSPLGHLRPAVDPADHTAVDTSTGLTRPVTGSSGIGRAARMVRVSGRPLSPAQRRRDDRFR